MVPSGSCLLVFMPPCAIIVPWLWARIHESLINNIIQQKRQDATYMNRVPRDCVLGCPLLIFCCLVHSLWGSTATMIWAALGESHMARNRCLHLTASDNLQPLESYVSMFGIRSSPSRTLRWLQPLLIMWLQSCERPWVRDTRMRHTWIPDPQKM